MQTELTQYIAELNRLYKTGIAREHTYRPALKTLLETILPSLTVLNDPARWGDCGAPDFILVRRKDSVPVAFAETKDLNDPDLAGRNKKNKEQFDRYKQSLGNIIFTDYLDFRFYENGEATENIRIAELNGDKIVPIKENFEKFESLLNHFGKAQPQEIKSSVKLAEIMAGKARLMAEVIEKVLKSNNDGSLAGQMEAFKEVLIHDISPKEFADVYAQTIAYGMFAARLHSGNPNAFSREEAAKLIPKTNPFLRQLFQNIAGYDLDERICWIVDDLAEAFRVTDMDVVMKGFGRQTQQTDPIIHFYENFLSAYDPELRKKRGVWYTPKAVVNFIVRAVDEVLQDEQNNFKLPMGLADKVQILDPATGTGTFLAETVRQIYEKFRGQDGMWQSYVEQQLIPRLNGFELLMASYTIAHINLDHLLSQTGYVSANDKRLNIYLTNSLQANHHTTGKLFAQFLAREVNDANRIKHDTPVMVVMGNPPYSGESKNKNEWIMELMDDYKKEPDSSYSDPRLNKLKERNSKWINDDYCKFIRMGQFFVDKNKVGILAYINNHSFIDNPTFRGMRWNLMRSFDKIYILDLHGNVNKEEICPDGSKDENVFNIKEGVSINIFVKTGHKAENALAEVYHFDLYGEREKKYDYLLDNKNKLSTIPFTKLKPTSPEYFFVPKDYGTKEEYDKGFGIQELFLVNSVGIVTARDNFTIHDTAQSVKNTINEFIKLDIETARKRFNLGKDARDWSIAGAQEDLNSDLNFNKIVEINYRPFDKRFTYYTGNSKGFHCMPRGNVMRHFINCENIGLVTCRQAAINSWELVNITKNIVDDSFVSNRTKERGYVFPLYIYSESDKLFENKNRKPNLNETIISEISQRVGLKFTPIDVLDYIYAVLHSPAYREKYKEFLKIDFPRVPYPENAERFWALVKLGGKLRKLHLMEGVEPQQGIADYPEKGSNEIEKPEYKNGKVWINSTQYFDHVPPEAWEFYIGGYQPAQKWLKDRKGRKLEFEDIRHYQRIVRVLWETREVMGEVEYYENI